MRIYILHVAEGFVWPSWEPAEGLHEGICAIRWEAGVAILASKWDDAISRSSLHSAFIQ